MKSRTQAKTGRGPGRLSAEATAELPDRLLDAALELFTAQGFAETTMEQIARYAGASTKTLYSRYAGKGEILEAISHRNVEQAMVAPLTAKLRDVASSLSPREFLIRFATQITSALNGSAAGIIRLTYANAFKLDVLKRTYRELNGRAVTRLNEMLDEWRAKGVIDRETDTTRAAELCFTLLTDAPRIRAVIGDPMTPAEQRAHIEAATDLFLRGLGYREVQVAEERPRRRRPAQ